MLAGIARGAHALRVIARGFVPVQMSLDVNAAATVHVTLQPDSSAALPAEEALSYSLAPSGLSHPLRPS
jgi:hypothetical protein